MSEVVSLEEYRERRETAPDAIVIPIGSYALYKTLNTSESFFEWLSRRVSEDESN